MSMVSGEVSSVLLPGRQSLSCRLLDMNAKDRFYRS